MHTAASLPQPVVILPALSVPSLAHPATHLVSRQLCEHGRPEGDDASGAALHIEQGGSDDAGAAVEEGHVREAVSDLQAGGKGGEMWQTAGRMTDEWCWDGAV